MSKADPLSWLVLVWRLPTSESSANRVSVWRTLRSLGAVGLTPGAAILPFTEDAQEQFDWLAQDIEDHGGDAWVLPVAHLSGVEERRLRERMRADRQLEYDALRNEALAFLNASERGSPPDRLAKERELHALQRRLRKIEARDFFQAPGRRQAASTIDRCAAIQKVSQAGRVPRHSVGAQRRGRALHHS